MNVLFCSHFFRPSVGGIERVGEILVPGIAAAGHAVRVLTQTPGHWEGESGFEVVREPSPAEVLRGVRWSDVVFQNNVSLQTGWPLAIWRRPRVVMSHTWVRRVEGAVGLRDRLKLRWLRGARNLAVSRALAESLGCPAEVIPNPYREDLFRRIPGVRREGDLIFVGRLVSDKGADVLLEALRRLRERGMARRLTVVGSGPERERLERMAEGLEVRFAGVLSEDRLAEALNAHRVMVVPSRWEEPFGLVAIEGLACGCAVVASSGGGLAEAVGPCGATFPNGDAAALAALLSETREPPDPVLVERHLAPHRRAAVVARVVRVIEETGGVAG